MHIPEKILNFRDIEIQATFTENMDTIQNRSAARLLYRKITSGQKEITGVLETWLRNNIDEEKIIQVIKLLQFHEAALKSVS